MMLSNLTAYGSTAAQADDRVKEDRGMVALTRGPLVFCAEALDNKGGVFNLLVPQDAQAHFSYDPTFLGGIGTIRAKIKLLNRSSTRIRLRAVRQLISDPLLHVCKSSYNRDGCVAGARPGAGGDNTAVHDCIGERGHLLVRRRHCGR